eukprot:GFYU01050480.1.p1 GENE.GFYU01050480.1~~GFYU01050480.1.p1  ORF type:complete len:177 (+),score=50.61 GFYU01050480.1:67-531(+)
MDRLVMMKSLPGVRAEYNPGSYLEKVTFGGKLHMRTIDGSTFHLGRLMSISDATLTKLLGSGGHPATVQKFTDEEEYKAVKLLETITAEEFVKKQFPARIQRDDLMASTNPVERMFGYYMKGGVDIMRRNHQVFAKCTNFEDCLETIKDASGEV